VAIAQDHQMRELLATVASMDSAMQGGKASVSTVESYRQARKKLLELCHDDGWYPRLSRPGL
tara:strand:+ start:660 stop:845 length:186 start_codon:yes stop_codon:yes gene_type:complete